MASLLTFAFTGQSQGVSVRIPNAGQSTVKSPLGQPTKSWAGVSGSACATVSATIATIVGRAVSKTSRKRSTRRSELHAFDPSQEVGAMAPFGYWDPLNLMREGFKNPTGEYKSQETFYWYRAAEIKHGRICMMAVLGLVAGEGFKWPGFEDIPGGVAALSTEAGGAGFGMIVLIAGIFELDLLKQDPSKEPGNFGDPAGWTRMDDWPGSSMQGNGSKFWDYNEEMRCKELAHCRLAMSGVITSLLLEYGGYDSDAQFNALKAGLLPDWMRLVAPVFVAGILLTVGYNDKRRFYVANDAGSLKPAYLGAAAAPMSLPEPVAPATPATGGSTGKGVLKKEGGKYRFS